MRVIEGEAIGKMIIPEEVVFAFNPNRVTVYSNEDNINVMIGEYTDKRETHGGVCVIDISKYLQLYVSETNRHADVEVKVSDKIYYYTFKLHVVWGALNIGEAYNEPKDREWFSEYPFTFEMYVPSDAKLEVSADGGEWQDVQGSGLVSVDVNELYPLANMVIFKLTRGESMSVFDYTFDYTFRDVVEGGVSTYIMKRNSKDCGAYLRWIDRHGFQNYYLFEKGDVCQIDKAADMRMGIFKGDDYEYLTSIYERKESTHNIALCAPLVNRETFAMLKTMNTSPCVELYYNGEWLPVNIEPTNIRQSRKVELVDYEVNMIYPLMMMQRL